jgi:hypothetical protein
MKEAVNRPWFRVVAYVLLGVLCFRFLFRWFERVQVYHPYKGFEVEPRDLPFAVEDLYWTTEDAVRLNGWLLTAPASRFMPRWVVLLCHGNGGNISHRTELYRVLIGLGFDVLAFDYRGYGRSEGRPTETGTYQDAQSAWNWLIRRGYRPEQILLFGESLGGAVAAEIASRQQPAGLILQSTFTSIPDIGAEIFPFLPVRRMATIRYDTLDKLPQVRAPVLILHGRGDTLVRFGHAERLYAAATSRRLLREIAGDHNDGPAVDLAGYRQAWLDFLDLLARAPDPGGGVHPIIPSP